MGREGGFHFTISWEEEFDADRTSRGMEGTGTGRKRACQKMERTPDAQRQTLSVDQPEAKSLAWMGREQGTWRRHMKTEPCVETVFTSNASVSLYDLYSQVISVETNIAELQVAKACRARTGGFKHTADSNAGFFCYSDCHSQPFNSSKR